MENHFQAGKRWRTARNVANGALITTGIATVGAFGALAIDNEDACNDIVTGLLALGGLSAVASAV